MPEDISRQKEEFMLRFYRVDWQPVLERIAGEYNAEMKRMPERVRRDLRANFCAECTYSTQRIEGSTMTRGETKNLLLHGASPSGRPENELHEALVHRDVLEQILDGRHEITMETVLEWHEKIFSRTDHAEAGALRRYQVEARGSRVEFPLWYDLEEEMEGFFSWYGANRGVLNPAELAALAHYKLVSIHPFGDGNGRIARLIMNCILHNGGYPMFIVRTEDRRAYLRALQRSDATENAAFFVRWLAKRYIMANRRYLVKA